MHTLLCIVLKSGIIVPWHVGNLGVNCGIYLAGREQLAHVFGRSGVHSHLHSFRIAPMFRSTKHSGLVRVLFFSSNE